MSTTPRPDFTERELARMTEDLHQLHGDSGAPALAGATSAWLDQVQSVPTRVTSRRSFLIGTGGLLAGAAAAVVLASNPGRAAAAAAARQSGAARLATTPNSQGGLGGLSGDVAVAGLAASLENLAVFAYNAGLQAAGAGKLGTVPPAVATFATTAMGQHRQHAAAWNAILTGAGKQPVTITEPTLTPVVTKQFAKVTDVTGLAELALELENVAAQTYQAEASRLHSSQAIATAATIQPVEMQHAAILYFVLGKYPGIQSANGTPLAFNPTTMAA